MRNELRVVIDTNVFVSALAFEDSVPFRAVEIAFTSGKILVSAETLVELEDVLRRPKLSRYFTEQDVESVLERLRREAEVVTQARSSARSRDPKDDALLDLLDLVVPTGWSPATAISWCSVRSAIPGL